MYVISLIIIGFIFTFVDKPELGQNTCEKGALTQLSNSPEKCVLLKNDCSVVAWDKITDPKASELDGRLLYYWGITKDQKLYYQK